MTSKRRVRRRQCAGKRRYEDAATAQRICGYTSRTFGDAWPFNVYKCQFCGGWHVGHERRRSGKRRKDFE